MTEYNYRAITNANLIVYILLFISRSFT